MLMNLWCEIWPPARRKRERIAILSMYKSLIAGTTALGLKHIKCVRLSSDIEPDVKTSECIKIQLETISQIRQLQTECERKLDEVK